MKHASIYPLLLLLLLSISVTACAPGGAQNKLNCSSKGEICITINSAQSFPVRNAYPIKIKVTSQNDITGLNVFLHAYGGIEIDGPISWENNLSDTAVSPGDATWTFDIKAGQTITFNRNLHFPHADGSYNVTAFVRTLDNNNHLEGYDSFDVFLVGDIGKTYKAGTPFPFPNYTPIDKSGVYGPGTPVPTYCCATEPPLPAPTFTLIVPMPTLPVPQGPYPVLPPYP